MPNSYTFFKSEIRQWFIDNVPPGTRILDVGPGQGTYADLLEGLGYKMDAVEVYQPYIERFYLESKYDTVYNSNIMNFSFWALYDFVILGDILEHLDKNSAQHLLHRIKENSLECMVAVPYMMEQDGEEYGNIHETHLQPDLSIENMSERYPDLELIYGNSFYGYYKMKDFKHEKAYVLYCTESYLETAKACVRSLDEFSDIPVYVYTLGFDTEIKGATVVKWGEIHYDTKKGKYIDRKDASLYPVMLNRPHVILDCLSKYAKTIAYVDSDSVATKYVDNIFNYYPYKSSHPYFVKGMYEWLLLDGKGAVESYDDMTTSLEHEACLLFRVNQQNRKGYRQTGYFVAGQWSLDFLKEWIYMCDNNFVRKDPTRYAPYHEETLVNVLLWKKKITQGLPYIYINASLEDMDGLVFTGQEQVVKEWMRMPAHKHELFFYHGEKDPKIMNRMLGKMTKKLNVLYLAPHLSTGGMPAFLLKRIECLQDELDITVVEYQNYSDDYVVQKNKIKELVPQFYTLGENKMELLSIIKKHRIDVVHVDEMIEGFDDSNRVPRTVIEALYAPDRTWRVVETCHNIIFKPDVEKMVQPDAYAFCTPYHLKTFANMPAPKRVLQYPKEPNTSLTREEAREILGFDPDKKHVINVGLWTPGKNQKEAVELARQLPDIQFHFVGNYAVNFKDYWYDIFLDLPENCHIHGERNDAITFIQAADVFLFNSVWECNPLVVREAISCGVKILARDLPQYEGMFSGCITPIKDNLKEQLLEVLDKGVDYAILPGQNKQFMNDHIDLYKEVLSNPVQKQKVAVIHNFVVNPFVEIKGVSDSLYTIRFYDEKDVVVYETTVKANHWTKLNRQWFTKWTIKVWEDGTLIFSNTLSLAKKRVYIACDSSSLGDTIAWIPYCLEFKKKHNCEVVVSTFHNYLFESVYPELEFIKPGMSVSNIYAQYTLGWHYDLDREPELPNTIPLQKAATNILGLEYKEIKPRIAVNIHEVPEDKYVTIATNSTAGCKFWTKEGWQDVINFLVDKGYKVINVSKEKNPFDNCTQLEDYSMDNTISHIHYSHFFIGLSSGLSWLAWGLGLPVVMISNFTEEDHEFKCIRVTDHSLCNGCWNSSEYKFDKSDWDWCPRHKNTPRHFECHRGISSQKVIDVLPI